MRRNAMQELVDGFVNISTRSEEVDVEEVERHEVIVDAYGNKSHDITSSRAVSNRIALHYVALPYIKSYRDTLQHIMSHHITSH